MERFCEVMADGFSRYRLFEWVCGNKYDNAKMSLFWRVTIELAGNSAICLADSAELNSVLVYLKPEYNEPSLWDYLRKGGITLLWKMGLRSAVRLLSFDGAAKRVSKKYRTEGCGYIVGFATQIDRQGCGYGSRPINALLRYLDQRGEGCYIETLRRENVAIYEHYGFQLMEQCDFTQADLTLYAMRR